MNAAPEKAVRALRVLSRVLCAAALTAPLAAAPSVEPDTAPDAAAWLAYAAGEARTITARGAGLSAALSIKGRLLADAAGLAAAGGGGGGGGERGGERKDAAGSDQAARWFTLSELCERALVHRQANGPVTAALAGAQARAGRADEAAARAEALPAGPDRERARAALAGALALADPHDPRAAELRSAADPAAAAAWAPAFAQADDFDGLAALAGRAQLTDTRRAALLAGLAEAQARSGQVAAAQRTLDRALSLGAETSNASVLALVGARAALGQVDAAAHAVDALQAPADRVRGLSRLAAAHAAAGEQAAALSRLRSAAEAAGRATGDDGLPGAVRELARVAADAGQAVDVGPWIDTLGDPRVRAAAALGLAEGLSPPALRPRMTQALTRPEAAAEPAVTADAADAANREVTETPDADADIAAGPQPTPAAAPAHEPAPTPEPEPAVAIAAERGATPAAAVDPAADAAGAELNDTAQQAIDQAMARLPGAPVSVGDAPEVAAAAPAEPRPELPQIEPLAAALDAPAERETTTLTTPAGSDTPPQLQSSAARPVQDHATPPPAGQSSPEAAPAPRAAADAPVNTAPDAASVTASDPSPVSSPEVSPNPAAEPAASTASLGSSLGLDEGLDEGINETPDDVSPHRAAAPADIVRAIDEPADTVAQVTQNAPSEPGEPGDHDEQGEPSEPDAPATPTDFADQAAAAAEADADAPDDAAASDTLAGLDIDPAIDPDAEPDTEPNAEPRDTPTVASADASASSENPAGPVAAVPDLGRLADPEAPQFTQTAPAVFEARFTTTRGAFTLRVHRAWAPRAADRFYQLCRAGFYNNNRFFRVVPGFVVQWGIHGFPSVATAWRNATIPDEPVRERNRRGTVSFAAAAVANTRTTQVFINLSDNAFLDDLGFAPFAEVTQGMAVVEQLFSGYGEAPSQLQRRIQLDGNAFLDANYPDLDGVVEVEIDAAPRD